MKNVGKAFTYMFEDEDWVTKILLGGVFVLLSIILIGIPFVIGYMVEVVQNVMAGRPKPLPDWTDLGDKFNKGLILAVALIVWAIPAILLSIVGSGVQAVGGAANSGALVAVGGLFSCLATIYNLALAFISPAIFIKYAEQPEFASAFKFNDIFTMITENLGNFLLVFVLSFIVGIVALFGLIALCIGVLFTHFWASLVIAHLYGELGRTTEMTAPTSTY